MKVVIDIPPQLLERVRGIVDQGDYDDPQEFITVALMNQAEMETSDQGTDEVMSLSEAMNLESEPSDRGEPGTVEPKEPPDKSNPEPLERSGYNFVKTADIPEQDRLEDGPLWGQYNRLFPVKLTLRRLANRLQEEAAKDTRRAEHLYDGPWTPSDQFKEEVATIAREFGTEIAKVDEQRSRTRMEKLTTGLPVGNDPEKSKERFKRHFVGNVDQGGNIAGAPPRLLFVNLPTEPTGTIGITSAGLEFARLHNPLLDEGVDADHSLSDEEIEFYLDHVENLVPDEYHAMQVVATAITEGINRPDDLTDRTSTINNEWSETHADTVRSGLVSRMVELGLVERERVGQRGIAYRLTTDGESFVDPDTINE